MNIYLTALIRLLHILFAFAWLGLAGTLLFFVMPAVAAAGESGIRFYKSLFTKTRIGVVFPIASGMTTLMGILLYIIGDAIHHFTSLGNVVLAAGAVAGLAATIHGGAVVGRSTSDLTATMAQAVPDDQPMPPDALDSIQGKAAVLASHSRVSFILMVIALVCMGSARYL